MGWSLFSFSLLLNRRLVFDLCISNNAASSTCFFFLFSHFYPSCSHTPASLYHFVFAFASFFSVTLLSLAEDNFAPFSTAPQKVENEGIFFFSWLFLFLLLITSLGLCPRLNRLYTVRMLLSASGASALHGSRCGPQISAFVPFFLPISFECLSYLISVFPPLFVFCFSILICDLLSSSYYRVLRPCKKHNADALPLFFSRRSLPQRGSQISTLLLMQVAVQSLGNVASFFSPFFERVVSNTDNREGISISLS